jgi:DNA-binding MarR family transcriptional regulator
MDRRQGKTMTKAGQTGEVSSACALDWGLFGDRIGPAVRLLRNELTVRISNAQAPFGLHSGGLSSMVLIHANPGCSQADLARELALDKSVLVAIIDDLERQGFARRGRSAIDRRRYSLMLTDEGERVMRAMLECGKSVEQPIADALSPEEYMLLITLLRRAYAALTADGGQGKD